MPAKKFRTCQFAAFFIDCFSMCCWQFIKNIIDTFFERHRIFIVQLRFCCELENVSENVPLLTPPMYPDTQRIFHHSQQNKTRSPHFIRGAPHLGGFIFQADVVSKSAMFVFDVALKAYRISWDTSMRLCAVSNQMSRIYILFELNFMAYYVMEN
jgi:hypothetical protein